MHHGSNRCRSLLASSQVISHVLVAWGTFRRTCGCPPTASMLGMQMRVPILAHFHWFSVLTGTCTYDAFVILHVVVQKTISPLHRSHDYFNDPTKRSKTRLRNCRASGNGPRTIELKGSTPQSTNSTLLPRDDPRLNYPSQKTVPRARPEAGR